MLHLNRIANIATAISLSLSAGLVQAQEEKSATYDDDVALIFKRHCLQCHGESKQEAGLNLASYAGVIKGGSGGDAVVAGRSSASLIFKAITAKDPEERMPPKSDPLPEEQISLIKAWIDGGVRQSIDSKAKASPGMTFKPALGTAIDGPAAMPDNLPVVNSTKTLRPFPILALATSPRAPLAAIAGYERIDFIDPATRDIAGSLAFPEGEPHVLRFSQSGDVLMAAGGRPVQNGVVILFDVKTGQRLAKIGDETDVVIAADLAPDQRQVAIGGSGRIVKVYSTEDGSLKHSLSKHTDWITAIAFSPDGKFLATGDRVGNIHLWDAESGGVVLPLSEHKGSVTALSWHSDGQVLASCGEDGLIVWWDVTKGWPLNSKADAHPPERPPGAYGKIANGVLDASFNARGELISCGRDNTVRIWSVDGSLRQTLDLNAVSQAGKNTTKQTPNARNLSDEQSSDSSGIRILPLRCAMTFDGTTAVTGDSAGQVHSWKINSP